MVSFVWAMNEFGWNGQELRFYALALTIACALLMVSRFRYTSFKGSKPVDAEREDKVPFRNSLLIVAILVALMIDASRVLLIMAACYALSGPVYALWQKLKSKPNVS